MTDIHDLKLEMHRKFSAMMDELDAMEANEPVTVEEVPAEPAPEPADDHDHDADTQTIYAAPDSNNSNILKTLTDKFRGGLKPGSSVVKGVDGLRKMLIVTSNSYVDREDETITSAALKEDVDRHWTAEDKAFMSNNPLLFWHDDDIEVGKIIFGDMLGPFYLEVAEEIPTPISKMYFDYREQYPNEKWGASHRFAYYSKDRNGDGDYRRIFKKETTTLPLEAAANLVTIGEVIPVSNKRAKKFDEIAGFDDAYNILKNEGIDAFMKRATEAGVSHKSVDEHAGPQEIAKAVIEPFAKSFVDMAEDLAVLDERIEKAVSDYEVATKEATSSKSDFDAAVDALKELHEQFQAKLDAKPRSASRATETEIENKDLDPDVANSLSVKDPVFGNLKPTVGG